VYAPETFEELLLSSMQSGELYWEGKFPKLAHPFHETRVTYIISKGVEHLLFNPTDIKVWEEAHGIVPQEIEPQHSQQNNADQIAKKGEMKNFFHHENDFWIVSFQGELLKPIKHSDGILYIAHLISKGHFHVSDLYETAHPKSGEKQMSEEELKKSLSTGVMSVSNMTIDKLDPEEKK